jgi:tRNA A-37 threonylcarbamoyl transferase component Bud32
VLGGKYVVQRKLGAGFEGEVYEVVESRTGVTRAAKLFYPHRNERDAAVKRYARKVDRLRHCRVVTQYHHSESLRLRQTYVTCLISEFVEGELLSSFVKRQRGRRLGSFEAGHVLLALASGLAEIHAMGEYHGDIHDDNVMIVRRGVAFDLKLIDFYNWGRPSAAHRRDDVVDTVRILYDLVGGARHYPRQPIWIKDICRGLRRDLILRRFPTAAALRQHLETFRWPE